MLDLYSSQTSLAGSLSDDIIALRKQSRAQELEWKKCKAVMEQRIEILELQVKEYQEREENLKQANSSIMSALDEFGKGNGGAQSKVLKDLEALLRDQQREAFEQKSIAQKQIAKLEKENRELTEKIAELELKVQQLGAQHKKAEQALTQNIHRLENENKSLTTNLKKVEDTSKKTVEKSHGLEAQVKDLTLILAKTKEDHAAETQRIQNEYKLTISNMKTLFASEKNALESQIGKIMQADRRESGIIEDIKKKYSDEISRVKRERDEVLHKLANCENQLKAQSENLKNLEEKHLKQKAERDAEDQELRKSRQKIADLEMKLRAIEGSDQKLKQQLFDKEQQLEESTASLKKKYSNERRKLEQQTEEYKKFKEEYKKYREEVQKKQVLLQQENASKDELIKTLKTQLEGLRNVKENRPLKRRESCVDKSLYQNKSVTINETDGVKEKRDKRNQSLAFIEDKENHNTSNIDSSKTETNSHENSNQEINTDNILTTRLSSGLTTRYSHSKARLSLVSTLLPMPVPQSSNADTQAVNKTLPHMRDVRGRENKEKASAQPAQTDRGLSKLQKNANMPRAMHNRSYSNATDRPKSVKVPMGTENMIKEESFESKDPLKKRSSGEANVIAADSSEDNFEISQLKLSDLNMTMNDIKRNFDEKYKEMEDKTRQAELATERMALERDRLQLELDRLILELKQTKMEWALTEERKEEIELTLRNEIKFLMNKLMQVKGSISGAELLSLTSKDGLNKSFYTRHASLGNFGGANQSSLGLAAKSVSRRDQNNLTGIYSNRSMLNAETNYSKFIYDADEREEEDEEANSDEKKNRCIFNSKITSPADSPRKISEFYENEISLVRNIHDTSRHQKKLICHINQL